LIYAYRQLLGIAILSVLVYWGDYFEMDGCGIEIDIILSLSTVHLQVNVFDDPHPNIIQVGKVLLGEILLQIFPREYLTRGLMNSI
jgi:hypothetical protein